MNTSTKFVWTPVAALAVALTITGCASIDEDALAARQALLAGSTDEAVKYGTELVDSHYTVNLGYVESGRATLLAGDLPAAEGWFRKGVESAVDRQESQPKIKLGDVGNTAMSATITDDRTRNYYLPPYELNLALEYAILSEALNGKKDDALVDARLACYIQDNLAQTYGADLAKRNEGESDDDRTTTASGQLFENQTAVLEDMMAASRNSWENPVLWWLTGVFFEADGEWDMACQSYRKAHACQTSNTVFAADAERAEKDLRTPVQGKGKIVILYEEGLVPQRESLKIPVPIYTLMSIDIPTYRKSAYPYEPKTVSIAGIPEAAGTATPALDVRSLAARDLNEQLPGIIARNITRAAVQAGAQVAANASGNGYVRIAVLAGNAILTAIRRADTRSWITLPEGQQVWECHDVNPGSYTIQIGDETHATTVPVTIAAGETVLIWVADCGTTFKTGSLKL